MRRALAVSLLTLACTAPRQAERPASSPPHCTGLAAPSAWLVEGPVLVGEVHGTEETPRLALSFACHAAASGKRAQLGLEHPRGDDASLQRFLRDGDRAALLAGDFWTRAYQDGRSSRAFVSVLEEVRRLRAAGLQLEVFAFDVDGPVPDRDLAMAERIHERWLSHGGPMVILVGNLHARTAVALPRPVGWRLQKLGLKPKALLVEAREGTAWYCPSFDPASCRSYPAGRASREEVPLLEITEGDTGVRGYGARVVLPTFTASPPAVASEASPAPPPPPSSSGR